MATVYSSLMTEYSGATGGWRSYLTYTTTTSDTAVTITCVGGIRSDYWTFAISSGITSTLSCTGQSSASGSGGLTSSWSSDVHNQLVSKTYTITRTSSAQTVTVKCSTTNSSGYINGTAAASVTITIPALDTVQLETYTIKYSANGGYNEPSSQTKTQSTDITLTSAVPVRGGYTFQGWSPDPTAKDATYASGETYSMEGNTILYAVWEYINTAAREMKFKVPDDASLSAVYARMYEDDSTAVLSDASLGTMRLGVM